jgi:predicted nucleic acid-binding protein
MTVVVDSSVCVAAFREHERFSREAFLFLQRIEKSEITAVIPLSVLVEVVAAIRRRTDKEALAAKVTEALLGLRSLTIVDLTAFRMTTLLDLAQRSGLRGMDILVVGVAKDFQIPLVTLDDELERQASLYVPTKTIHELIT